MNAGENDNSRALERSVPLVREHLSAEIHHLQQVHTVLRKA